MLKKEYEYDGYKIEFEHPIYHDFEYVIKTTDGKKVIATSNQAFDQVDDAENEARLVINSL